MSTNPSTNMGTTNMTFSSSSSDAMSKEISHYNFNLNQQSPWSEEDLGYMV